MNKFVCRDVFPPRKHGNARDIMYGGWAGAETDPRRVCCVCQRQPILRHVKFKGYCSDHLTEAWAEHAKYPIDIDWILSLPEYRN